MRNRERKIAAFWRPSFHQGAGTDSSGIASFPIPYSPFPVSKFQPAHLVAGELHNRREAVNASKESKNKCPIRNSPQPAARTRGRVRAAACVVRARFRPSSTVAAANRRASSSSRKRPGSPARRNGSIPRSSTWTSTARCRRCCCVTCRAIRSEEHTSELQSLMRISYAVFCLKKKKKNITNKLKTENKNKQ